MQIVIQTPQTRETLAALGLSGFLGSPPELLVRLSDPTSEGGVDYFQVPPRLEGTPMFLVNDWYTEFGGMGDLANCYCKPSGELLLEDDSQALTLDDDEGLGEHASLSTSPLVEVSVTVMEGGFFLTITQHLLERTRGTVTLKNRKLIEREWDGKQALPKAFRSYLPAAERALRLLDQT